MVAAKRRITVMQKASLRYRAVFYAGRGYVATRHGSDVVAACKTTLAIEEATRVTTRPRGGDTWRGRKLFDILVLISATDPDTSTRMCGGVDGKNQICERVDGNNQISLRMMVSPEVQLPCV
jgi:hypothetical protein